MQDAKTRVFQTARNLPKLLLITTALTATELIVTIPLDPPEEYRLPLKPAKEELIDLELIEGIDIWNSDVDGYAVSSDLDQALTQFLHKPVRIVVKGPKHRETGQDTTYEPLNYEKRGVNYQDFYPMTVASTSSLIGSQEAIRQAVRSKLDDIEHLDKKAWTEERIQSVSIERWRPNIVVDGPLNPFEEDAWEAIEVGKHTVFCVARAFRCMLHNLEPKTAVRDAAVPWSILQRFRVMEPELIPKYCFVRIPMFDAALF